MPPRYAYWTIIVDDKPTAFRSGAKEDLLPTFNRLKSKNDTAVMMWFQNGKLWPSRIDAQEAMIGRGEAGRRSDPRQSGTGFRDRERRPTRDRVERTAWTPRGEPSTPPPARNADDKLDWKPKGEFTPAPKRADRPERSERSDWKPKASFDRDRKPTSRSEKPEWKPKGAFTPAPRRSEKSDWKPKGSFDREERPRSFKRPDFKPSADDSRSAKPEWKPKGTFDRKAEWKPRASFDRGAKPDWKSKPSSPQARKPAEKLDWKPKGEGSSRSPIPDPGSPKRKWVPKEEYKKSMGIEAKRDSKWRPGGEHKDPRQKYKDAKKAKWTKFKKNIRARSGGKGKKQS